MALNYVQYDKLAMEFHTRLKWITLDTDIAAHKRSGIRPQTVLLPSKRPSVSMPIHNKKMLSVQLPLLDPSRPVSYVNVCYIEGQPSLILRLIVKRYKLADKKSIINTLPSLPKRVNKLLVPCLDLCPV